MIHRVPHLLWDIRGKESVAVLLKTNDQKLFIVKKIDENPGSSTNTTQTNREPQSTPTNVSKMALSSAQLVLDNTDLVRTILSKGELTYPELQGVQPVNKAFREVAVEMHHEKYQLVKRIFNDVYGDQMSKYRKALSIPSKFRHSASLLRQISMFELWPFLVHNPDMAENLFMLWCDMHPYARYFPEVSEMYDASRRDLSKYVLFEDVSFMTIKTMRKLVSFKGIRGAWTMSKRKLVQHLKRPEDHVYYWNM